MITSANNKKIQEVHCTLAPSLLSSTRESKRFNRQVEIGTWFGSEDRGGYGKHFGPVYSVKRNPFHPKFFLSVGDWCGKMWMEELKGAVLGGAVPPTELT